MTAPTISVETVEQLDLTPVCEGKHGGTPPPADWRLDRHGCGGLFLCSACESTVREGWAALGGEALVCEHCGGSFTQFDQAYPRVVPLR